MFSVLLMSSYTYGLVVLKAKVNYTALHHCATLNHAAHVKASLLVTAISHKCQRIGGKHIKRVLLCSRTALEGPMHLTLSCLLARFTDVS